MSQHPDQRPIQPTPEQADRFLSIVDRIKAANLVDEGHLHIEEVDGEIGLTIEEDHRVKPVSAVNHEAEVEEAPNERNMVFYYDFILQTNGIFRRHVTCEPLDDRIERELLGKGVLGPITRHRQQDTAKPFLDADSQQDADRIAVSVLNAKVDLGVVNPLELDEGLDKAEEILGIYED